MGRSLVVLVSTTITKTARDEYRAESRMGVGRCLVPMGENMREIGWTLMMVRSHVTLTA